MFGIRKLTSNENIVSFAVPIKVQINLDVLNELAQGISPIFLTCSYQANETYHILTFDTGGTQALDGSQINNDAFLPDILDALNECESKSISFKNLILEASLLFVFNNRLKFILLPIDNQSPESFKKVVKRFVKVINPFLQNKTTRELIRKTKNSNNEDEIRQHLKDAQIKPSNEQEDLPVQSEDDTSSESETTFLSQGEETETTFLSPPLNIEGSSEAETTFLSEDEQKPEKSPAYGETALLLHVGPELPVNAFLIRNKTGLRIPINKTLFMIGNVGGNVDYQVDDNDSISRHHASIIFEGGSCFIMDNKSTNQSFVEGSAIPPYEKIELDNGALFTLGNENFQIFMEAR